MLKIKIVDRSKFVFKELIKNLHGWLNKRQKILGTSTYFSVPSKGPGLRVGWRVQGEGLAPKLAERRGNVVRLG